MPKSTYSSNVRSVKSAERVLDVFELFAERQNALRLRDITEALQLPPSSATQLLKGLCARGYLSYDRVTRVYFPTQRLCDIADAMRDEIRPAAFAHILDTLHRETGEFIMLGLMNDLYVQYVTTLRSTQVIQFFTPSGVMRPLVRAGLGWALLSDLADERIESIYAQTWYRGLIDRDEWPLDMLWSKIEVVRRNGVALSCGTIHAGASVLAVKLPPGSSGQHYSVGVSGPSARLEQNMDSILGVFQKLALCP